ncbi:uncharacterized protein EV154DRAFT_487038 [Mucor mucedo]|uniref:uncharacterized protein n=1 Tax=Mucor mucedo TaxID=29922 RepID=UPI00221EC532|nr:uncharacterized protein EV154DRAFT_487038 [Mucor mucedo]KAI7873836.1 hypothetical protein EV154DRAFT_487038 [Mucor mucedo]
MIGNAAFQAQYAKEASESDFHRFYLKIFPSENLETMTLLTACLEVACNSDAGLRDYGAEFIQEFVKGSTDGARNTLSLPKRLFNLMTSPSSTNRFRAYLMLLNVSFFQRGISSEMSEVDHPSIGTHSGLSYNAPTLCDSWED